MDEKRQEKHDKLKAWFPVKEELHFYRDNVKINEGEIWWCSCGENIGVEINGKNDYFTRPVLVLKKFGHYEFFGVPLTSKRHTGSWYVHLAFKNKNNSAVLCQAKTFSIYRLRSRMGQLTSREYLEVKEKFIKLLR